jgi:hypothetical protein
MFKTYEIHLPSGKLPHNYGQIHHFIAGWINYFYGPSTIWLFNSSPWKDPPFSSSASHLFLWAIYPMAMLVITRGYIVDSLEGCQGCYRNTTTSSQVNHHRPSSSKCSKTFHRSVEDEGINATADFNWASGNTGPSSFFHVRHVKVMNHKPRHTLIYFKRIPSGYLT